MRRASQAYQEQDFGSVEPRRPSYTRVELELETPAQSSSSLQPLSTEPRGTEFSLPPTDGGKDAWLALLGCFCAESLVWGVPFTYGLFQEYYSSSPDFADGQSSIAIIGTATLGLLYLGSPVILLSLRQWPQYRRKSTVAGLVVIVLALLTASFTTRVWQLILTQGILYAIGGILVYYPALLFVDEWWVRRKGLAFGTAWAGTGFSGVALPFFVSWSLENYSFRTTLRILAIVYIVVLTPALFILKPRLPISAVSNPGVPSIHFLWKRPFLSFQLGSLFESLGYFLPGLFLPSYARFMGFSGVIATVSVVLLNLGNFLGCLMIGFLVDRWHVTNVILLSTVGSTLSVSFLWGFANSVGLLCIFAFLYGFFAGSFSATWPGVVRETMVQNQRVESGLSYALLVSGRGIGSAVSGPLSNALLSAGPLSDRFSYGYGSKYGALIMFAGISNALGVLSFVARHIGWA